MRKKYLIDQLLHGFHWSVKYGMRRPVGVNLIEDRLKDVILFLDELSYGSNSTGETLIQKDEWVVQSQNARSWAFKGR